MSRSDFQFKLRLPPGIKSKIEQAARDNHRSINAEVISRLTSGQPDTSHLVADADLRDRFAMAALQGLLASYSDALAPSLADHAEHYSTAAFIYADAMLVARQGGAG